MIFSIVQLSPVANTRNQKLLKQFGKSLRQIRTQRNLSQEALANDADIPINQIGRIERGEINPTLSTLSSISKALGIKIVDLLAGY
jgi:transcriptional regulator with XRE-family HTH domain